MSVVACKIYDDRIVMASDSIMTYGWSQTKSDNTSTAKMFRTDQLIVGGCGNVQELSIFNLYCQTRRPETANQSGILNFMHEFADFQKGKSGVWGINNQYLIVFDGHVFYVEDGFCVMEITTHEAIGAGFAEARTALYLGHTPEEAVGIACDLCVFCERPVVVMEAKRGK